MISEQEAEKIKKQLIEQINSTFPDDKKKPAIEQLNSMDNEQLEKFLIQNNLIKQDSSQSDSSPSTNCPFCLISQEKIKAYKLDENSLALAVLEINPMSEGHTIIIPKQHCSTDDIPSKALELAKKISKKLKSKLNPESVEISTSNIAGHSVINVIPVYKNKNPEKKKANEQELKKLQEKLTQKPRIIRKSPKKQEKILKAPKRIP
jgi:histidine triad (HIT) family protein